MQQEMREEGKEKNYTTQESFCVKLRDMISLVNQFPKK